MPVVIRLILNRDWQALKDWLLGFAALILFCGCLLTSACEERCREGYCPPQFGYVIARR